jgi:GH24 family phage-related lysozyme (muramidase)
VNLNRQFAFTSPYEGCTDYMYLDTKGLVTVGVGCMLPTAAAAVALPFDPHDRVELEYAIVHAAPAGQICTRYAGLTKARLPASHIRALFDFRCNGFANVLRSYFAFDALPEGAQVALLDMAFNLGASAVCTRWPALKVAIRHADWVSAAHECHRDGVSAARNAATASLFASCRTVV